MDKAVLVEQLNEGFKYLTDRERMILTLFYFEELTEAEICHVLDLEYQTVNVDLAQAKTKMRGYTTIFDDIDEIGRKSLSLIH